MSFFNNLFKNKNKITSNNSAIIKCKDNKDCKFYVDEQKSNNILNSWNDNTTIDNPYNENANMKKIKMIFKEKLKCEFIPVGVINYYLENNGEDIAAGYILSLENIVDETSNFRTQFLPFMDMTDENDKFIPVADDGMGGYYVFSSKRNEEKIYYLDHEYGPTKIDSYENFGQWYDQMKKIENE